MAATPMHAANSKAVKARTRRLPINRRWPGIWTVLLIPLPAPMPA
jgi:hypothetical protein